MSDATPTLWDDDQPDDDREVHREADRELLREVDRELGPPRSTRRGTTREAEPPHHPPQPHPPDQTDRSFPMPETATPSPTTGRASTIARPGPLLVTVRQACEMLGLGRTSVYHLVRTGQLRKVQIGGAVRFSVDHLREFVDTQATG